MITSQKLRCSVLGFAVSALVACGGTPQPASPINSLQPAHLPKESRTKKPQKGCPWIALIEEASRLTLADKTITLGSPDNITCAENAGMLTVNATLSGTIELITQSRELMSVRIPIIAGVFHRDSTLLHKEKYYQQIALHRGKRSNTKDLNLSISFPKPLGTLDNIIVVFSLPPNPVK